MNSTNSSFSFFERDGIHGLYNKNVKKIYHFGDLVLFEFINISDGNYTQIEDAAKDLVAKQKVLLLKYFQKDKDWIEEQIESGFFTNRDWIDFSNFVNPIIGDLIASSGENAYISIIHCVKNGIASDHITLKIVDKQFYKRYQDRLLQLRRNKRKKEERFNETLSKYEHFRIFLQNNEKILKSKFGTKEFDDIKVLLQNSQISSSNTLYFYTQKNTDDLKEIYTKIQEFKNYLEGIQTKERLYKLEQQKAIERAQKEEIRKARMARNEQFLQNIRTTYDVEYLYHFTSKFNIPSINEYGLIGWETLEKEYNFIEGNDYKSSSNELSRNLDIKSGYTNHVRLCRTMTHHMVNKARERNPDLVFLKIKLEVLTDLECVYSNDNTTMTANPPVIDKNFRTFFEADQDRAEILVWRYLPANYIVENEV